MGDNFASEMMAMIESSGDAATTAEPTSTAEESGTETTDVVEEQAEDNAPEGETDGEGDEAVEADVVDESEGDEDQKVEGEEDPEEGASEEDDEAKRSRSQRRNEARKRRFAALEEGNEKLSKEVTSSKQDLAEAVEMGMILGGERDALIEENAALRAQLEGLGHGESAEAKQLREMKLTERKTEIAKVANEARAKAEARGNHWTPEMQKLYGDAVEAGVTHDVDVDTIIEAMRAPQHALVRHLGLKAGMTFDEVASRIAASRAGKSAPTEAAPSTAKARKQLTQSQAAPKPIRGSRRPAPRKYEANASGMSAFVEDWQGD